LVRSSVLYGDLFFSLQTGVNPYGAPARNENSNPRAALLMSLENEVFSLISATLQA
jgi:hypothetical protein